MPPLRCYCGRSCEELGDTKRLSEHACKSWKDGPTLPAGGRGMSPVTWRAVRRSPIISRRKRQLRVPSIPLARTFFIPPSCPTKTTTAAAAASSTTHRLGLLLDRAATTLSNHSKRTRASRTANRNTASHTSLSLPLKQYMYNSKTRALEGVAWLV